MSAVERIVSGEITDFQEFFAPASTDMIDGLIGQYKQARAKIDQVAAFMATEVGSVLNYFTEGNKGNESWYGWERMFDPVGALGELNADYWNRALRLTDVIDFMPQKRRDEWFEQIRNPLGKKRDRHSKEYQVPPLPEFTEETVRATISDLLVMRGQFFAERVDGLFRSLSGSHVTNEPQGFSKRMIIAGVLGSWGNVESSRSGYINDLRAVIAKFMGRDEPKYGATDTVIHAAKRNAGQWMPLDGGALRIRVYVGVGTAHLEVHPEMAWRLNCVLASLYPAAIPPKFRQKPPKKSKDFVMMGTPLPFAVISELASMKEAAEPIPNDHNGRTRRIPNTLKFSYSTQDDRTVIAEAEKVIGLIGGVKVERNSRGSYFQFDYDPASVIDEIVCSGCVPHQKSHQFYPTPERLAQIAIELAEITDEHDVLEPSAGIGGLADMIKTFNTIHCVEISELHCKVLEAKGYSVVQGDFLDYANVLKPNFHRVVMNPPFSQGRWQEHLLAASRSLCYDGRLVAILPSSAKGKDDLLPDFKCEWSEVYENEFSGTSVSVVILKADKLNGRAA